MSNLLIIESPNKIKSIGKYIDPKKFKIMATYGHIRDLSSWAFGFNTETYEIKWTITENKKIKNSINKKELIKQINQEATKAKEIYLATDPDREGEAIAWHVFNVLDKKNQEKCKRITFNEITKNAITQSFKLSRDLNQPQINSYLARRLLDRYIGFMLSSYTIKKIGGISAGRVQSIALKFLRDKDIEVKSFVPDSWFVLNVTLKNKLTLTFKKISPSFLPPPKLKEGIKSDNLNFQHKEEIQKLVDQLEKQFKLTKIANPKIEQQAPPTSFKTSTLLEFGIKKLHMSSKTVERTAQKLYEGVDLDGETLSLITYPRTDRSDFSSTFLEQAKEFISDEYSPKYFNTVEKKAEKKEDLVQGAHEGIRPTDINLMPSEIKGLLPDPEYKLYELIWVYSLCSLMPAAQYENTTLHFENAGHLFQENIKKEIFDGYKILMKNYPYQALTEVVDLKKLDLKIGSLYDPKTIEVVESHKRPPTPYTEATLIKALESKGIGRPSTYATITNVVLNREYATKEKSSLIITELGLKVSEDLSTNFSNFIHYEYTKQMEKELDNISEDKTEWKSFLNSIFAVFNKDYKKAKEDINESAKIPDRQCPNCKADLLTKFNYKTKNKFIGCSAYPECKFLENIDGQNGEKLDRNCPDCSKILVKKKNKWNRFFISCSGYPECKYIENLTNNDVEKLDKNCPNCEKQLVKRKNKWNNFFISCSGFPDCKYIESKIPNNAEKLDEKCPNCQKHLVKRKNKWNTLFISCSGYPECKYIQKTEKQEKTVDIDE